MDTPIVYHSRRDKESPFLPGRQRSARAEQISQQILHHIPQGDRRDQIARQQLQHLLRPLPAGGQIPDRGVVSPPVQHRHAIAAGLPRLLQQVVIQPVRAPFQVDIIFLRISDLLHQNPSKIALSRGIIPFFRHIASINVRSFSTLRHGKISHQRSFFPFFPECVEDFSAQRPGGTRMAPAGAFHPAVKAGPSIPDIPPRRAGCPAPGAAPWRSGARADPAGAAVPGGGRRCRGGRTGRPGRDPAG